MSVLVYTETDQGKFKKNAWEVASYAHGLAQKLGTEAVAHAADVVAERAVRAGADRREV